MAWLPDGSSHRHRLDLPAGHHLRAPTPSSLGGSSTTRWAPTWSARSASFVPAWLAETWRFRSVHYAP
ncbi:MAG TPA: hypothetical protein VKA24_04395 [Gaiellaceae bacterium]|nr:hypothetical protein [Gaiellaceae bacterium]